MSVSLGTTCLADQCGQKGVEASPSPDTGRTRRRRQCEKAALSRSTWSATALPRLSASGAQAKTRLWSR